jgi:hypothetical protein
MTAYKVEVFGSDGATAISFPNGQDVAHLRFVDRETAADDAAEADWRELTDDERQRIVDAIHGTLTGALERLIADELTAAQTYFDTYDVPGEWLTADGSWKDWESEAEGAAAEGKIEGLKAALKIVRGETSKGERT